jgi:hypothetical protein
VKAVVSLLTVLALIVLFAYIVLPRGSNTSPKAAEKPERFVGKAVSSRAMVEGVDAAKMAWAKNRRDHLLPNRR